MFDVIFTQFIILFFKVLELILMCHQEM